MANKDNDNKLKKKSKKAKVRVFQKKQKGDTEKTKIEKLQAQYETVRTFYQKYLFVAMNCLYIYFLD